MKKKSFSFILLAAVATIASAQDRPQSRVEQYID